MDSENVTPKKIVLERRQILNFIQGRCSELKFSPEAIKGRLTFEQHSEQSSLEGGLIAKFEAQLKILFPTRSIP